MATQTFQNLESITPSKKEIAVAQQSSKILTKIPLKKDTSIDIVFSKTTKKQNISLPASAFKLLISILAQMAEGNAVTLIPLHAELTTQEAATLLNVSRPFFIRLLETKKIPFRKVGSHRKVLFIDVMAYKTKTDKARHKVLNDLTKEAQKLKLGY